MCGKTTEQMVQEYKEGDTFIFPSLDRILPLGVPDPTTTLPSLASARCLLKESVKIPYAKMLEYQLLELLSKSMSAFHSQLPTSIRFLQSCVTACEKSPFGWAVQLVQSSSSSYSAYICSATIPCGCFHVLPRQWSWYRAYVLVMTL